MAGTKMYTLDQFFGLNEAAETTEMALGEASRIENFTITDGLNLKTRPGAARLLPEAREKAQVLAVWSGYIGETETMILVDFLNGTDRIFIYKNNGAESQQGALGLTQAEDSFVKIISFAGNVFIMSAVNTVVYNGSTFVPALPYIPTVSYSTAPSGGGGTGEGINLLSPLRRIEFSADGEATAFVFPEEAKTVTKLEIDNVSYPPAEKGSWSAETHTFTFTAPPTKGVSNVMFEYGIDEAEAEARRMQIVRTTLWETYNGATDSRLFLAGDGSNRCYYSGVPASGDLSQLYFPGLNEVAVDDSAAPITGLIRHYGKLLAFTKDNLFTIGYQPVTLVDGNTIAGFMVRAVSSDIGNTVMGQLQTVDNCARSLTEDGIYEWKMLNAGYRDERNYSLISEKVSKTLHRIGTKKAVTCDDNGTGTYYVFLNDREGTVLVNRYLLGKRPGVWTIYKAPVFRNVTFAEMYHGDCVFVHNGELFNLTASASADAPEVIGGENRAINSIWESGFMAFGEDYLRKYSSMVYVSLKPESYCNLGITAETDRRSQYLTKFITDDLFSFKNLNFGRFTFKCKSNPKIHRVRLKVKKFVYYQLILKSEDLYSNVTVLGIDQQVRFASMAK